MRIIGLTSKKEITLLTQINMKRDGEQFYLPTTDLNMRARIIAAIKTRIEEINKEIEEL